MKIELTKEQYRELITIIEISNSVLGVLGDSFPDGDYKEESQKLEKLENYFLQYAKDFSSNDLVEDYKGKKIINEKLYENKILSIMNDFDEYIIFNELSNRLAWRDFRREHSEKEMDQMRKKNEGYFGVELHDYEKKYWDEFEEHYVNRLEIKE